MDWNCNLTGAQRHKNISGNSTFIGDDSLTGHHVKTFHNIFLQMMEHLISVLRSVLSNVYLLSNKMWVSITFNLEQILQ